MLVLTRKAGESILIGDDIRITIARLDGSRVRVAIDAPRHVSVQRDDAKPKDDHERGKSRGFGPASIERMPQPGLQCVGRMSG
ncbi:Carbon storage regulator [Planctomycetes bacterium Pan216]|uniref:Translational regulator CsrA n=1 Tax=Kolteria novifilia TaxID=2527975 RepID=A0A518AYQ7_9BACT|nr:Carbon storage regulator [Planctomycetes bacterium Pan216]